MGQKEVKKIKGFTEEMLIAIEKEYATAVEECEENLKSVHREEGTKTSGEDAASDIDGSQRSRKDVAIRLHGQKIAKLSKIRLALANFRKGEFGICPECSEGISEKRLKACPEAVLCADCKGAREAEWRNENGGKPVAVMPDQEIAFLNERALAA